MKIIDSLLRLKEVLLEQEGEISSIILNKKGVDALNAECQKLCGHIPVGTCPTCGKVNINNEVLGIKIVIRPESPLQVPENLTGKIGNL